VEDKKNLFYLRIESKRIRMALEERISEDESFILREIEELKKVYSSDLFAFFFGKLNAL